MHQWKRRRGVRENQRETPAVQTSRKETLVSKAAAESYQPADETVYVTGDRVNLRRQGSSDSPVIGRVNKGTEMKRQELATSGAG